jgi:nucleotide-binding universal stress UspA family protein
MRHRAGLPEGEIGKIREYSRTNHQSRVKELVARHAPGVSKNSIHVVQGEGGKLIPFMAKDEEIDLIVMGTVGRIGLSGMLIGNTAERILNNVNCSVLAVKPDGFTSPVKLDD